MAGGWGGFERGPQCAMRDTGLNLDTGDPCQLRSFKDTAVWKKSGPLALMPGFYQYWCNNKLCFSKASVSSRPITHTFGQKFKEPKVIHFIM